MSWKRYGFVIYSNLKDSEFKGWKGCKVFKQGGWKGYNLSVNGI